MLCLERWSHSFCRPQGLLGRNGWRFCTMSYSREDIGNRLGLGTKLTFLAQVWWSVTFSSARFTLTCSYPVFIMWLNFWFSLSCMPSKIINGTWRWNWWRLTIIERLSLTFTIYGKRQTANGKNKTFASIFSSLYSRFKRFVFAVNSKRHFSIFVWFI